MEVEVEARADRLPPPPLPKGHPHAPKPPRANRQHIFPDTCWKRRPWSGNCPPMPPPCRPLVTWQLPGPCPDRGCQATMMTRRKTKRRTRTRTRTRRTRKRSRVLEVSAKSRVLGKAIGWRGSMSATTSIVTASVAPVAVATAAVAVAVVVAVARTTTTTVVVAAVVATVNTEVTTVAATVARRAQCAWNMGRRKTRLRVHPKWTKDVDRVPAPAPGEKHLEKGAGRRRLFPAAVLVTIVVDLPALRTGALWGFLPWISLARIWPP